MMKINTGKATLMERLWEDILILIMVLLHFVWVFAANTPTIDRVQIVTGIILVILTFKRVYGNTIILRELGKH